MKGTMQRKATHAIRMMVFKNLFSFRIRISCARLSLEFCVVPRLFFQFVIRGGVDDCRYCDNNRTTVVDIDFVLPAKERRYPR